jgi:hypothetical protein
VQPASTKTVYVNPDTGVNITCDHCRRTHRVEAAVFGTKMRSAKVRCPCGYQFQVTIERRRSRRIDTHLPGQYEKIARQPTSGIAPGPRHDDRTVQLFTVSGSMLIENLSFFGVSFRTDTPAPIVTDDLVKIEFILETAPEVPSHDSHDPDRVVKYMRVRWVKGRLIGGEFCDTSAYAERLEAYLNAH